MILQKEGNTGKMILQWDSFEIVADETFEFLLPINGYFPGGDVDCRRNRFLIIILLEIKSKIHRIVDENVLAPHSHSDTSPEGETSTNRLTFKQVPCSNGDANPCHTPGQMGSGSHCTQVASNRRH